MKRIFLLVLLIPVFCFADISTWNGLSITTSTSINGGPGFSSFNGDTVVAAGGAGTLYIYPNVDGYGDDWDPLGAGSHYVEIDDDKDSIDNDTTYVSTATNYEYEVGNLQNDTGDVLNGKTITNVTVYVESKSSAGTPAYKITIRTGDSNYQSGDKSQTTSYVSYNNAWATNPNTSVAWTQSDINALKAGAQSRSIGGNTIYITSVYVAVAYE